MELISKQQLFPSNADSPSLERRNLIAAESKCLEQRVHNAPVDVRGNINALRYTRGRAFPLIRPAIIRNVLRFELGDDDSGPNTTA